MRDEPEEVREARRKLQTLVGPAVDAVEGLLDSHSEAVRLGAAKEVMDRGGLPAKQQQDVHVDVTLDSRIELALAKISKQREIASNPVPASTMTLLEGQPVQLGLQLTAGEDLDDDVAEAELVEEDDAWWQAAPEEA